MSEPVAVEPLTPEQFAAKMKAIFYRAGCAVRRDTESAHQEADDALCEMLRSLGYGDGVVWFNVTPKWYA